MDGDTTITTPPPGDQAPPDKPADKPADKPTDQPDLAAQVAALTAQLTALTAERTAEKAKAEETRRATLTEQQKLEEDRKAVDAEKATLKAEARKAALDKYGINPKVAALAPDVDPRTAEGQAALEQWARANPEFITKREGGGGNSGLPLDAPPKSKLAQFFSGEKVNLGFSVEHAKRLLSGQ